MFSNTKVYGRSNYEGKKVYQREHQILERNPNKEKKSTNQAKG